MSEINFLPESFKRQRQRKLRRPVEFAVIGGAMLGLIGLSLYAGGPDRALADKSEKLDEGIVMVQRLQDEQARLDQERSELQRRLLISRETYQPISMTQVLARISALTPEPVRLIELELVTQRPAPEQRPDPTIKQTRVVNSAGASAAQALPDPSTMKIEITGYAPSDVELVTLIRALDDDPVFTTVALRSSRVSETKTHQVREFHLDLVIDLDRRFIHAPVNGGPRDED